MKIGLQTWGSNGDIRPMIALAHGLQKAGHEVKLVIASIDNCYYDQQCAEYQIPCQHIPAEIPFDLPAFAKRTFHMNTAQWLVELLNESFFPYEGQIYQASRQLANESDVVIGHHFLYPMKLAAYQADKPFYSVTFCPAGICTPGRPPFRCPDLGNRINALLWQCLETVFNLILKKRMRRLLDKEGFPAFKSVLADLLTSDSLNLVAVDPVFCPDRNLWLAQHQACGFLELPVNLDDWPLSPELQDFLAEGPAPVYMTFGSLQQAVPEWSMELFTKAADLAGCRAIIQTSSDKYPANSCNDNMFFVDKHPHQTLFKQCFAVVHHGGAGTSHTATLCGRPSIIIPFMDEQLYWGTTLYKLNLAAKPIRAKHVTAKRLSKAICQTLQNTSTQHQAAITGPEIASRQGVSNAVDLIEHHYQRNYRYA